MCSSGWSCLLRTPFGGEKPQSRRPAGRVAEFDPGIAGFSMVSDLAVMLIQEAENEPTLKSRIRFRMAIQNDLPDDGCIAVVFWLAAV